MTNKIFILMDDSGKLNNNENSCIYGGLFFYSNNDYINFINKYKSVIKSIRCKYCNKCISNCNKDCIEVKGTTKLKPVHKRQIFNLIKKENNFGVFIENKKVYKPIMAEKASRGRYIDYVQKRIIKEIVNYSIKNKYIDPTKQVKLIIKIDDSKTKSNGYYNLVDSIQEELVNGIINYDYATVHKPILNSSLIIKSKNYNSKYHYGIQSADMIAHYLHGEYEKYLINGKDLSSTINFIEVKLFLPGEKKEL